MFLMKKIPLEYFTDSDFFVLTGMRQVREYVDGKATERIIGWKYMLADPATYATFQVKVIGQQPIYENIDNHNGPLFVELTNPEVAYYVMNGRLGVTVTADSISIKED